MTQTVMKIDDLHLSFPVSRSLLDVAQRKPGKSVNALNGVSLELQQGETLGVVGESGCGKSTLARCIVRLYEPTSGQIHFDDENIKTIVKYIKIPVGI